MLSIRDGKVTGNEWAMLAARPILHPTLGNLDNPLPESALELAQSELDRVNKLLDDYVQVVRDTKCGNCNQRGHWKNHCKEPTADNPPLFTCKYQSDFCKCEKDLFLCPFCTRACCNEAVPLDPSCSQFFQHKCSNSKS